MLFRSTSIGINDRDLTEGIISNAYKSPSSGVTYIYLQQSFKTLPVYNQLVTLAFSNGQLVSKTGSIIEEIDQKVNSASIFASITPEKAVLSAIRYKKITFGAPLVPFALVPGKKYDYGKAGIANENITAELLWVPDEIKGAVKLAWQVRSEEHTS